MRRLLIIPTAAAVLLTSAAPAALAADEIVTHRQSVLTEVTASGSTGTSRIFTQLTVPKGEKATLAGQSTSALRSLTGTADQEGDNVVFGEGLTRTVADHTAELPVELEVSYATDGQTVEPRDVVGHDGEVAVTYIVRNLTSREQEVTISDGDRVASTETVDVAVPMVGSLSMTLPPAFSDVEAPGAVVVGDGRGNTVITWSLLLFSPLGSETQEVTWTANANDAVVPEALLQVVPVSPASFGSFDSTASAYEGAVGSTRELTSGARQIDRNLKLLADGAGKLLAGLTQLRDGSAELAAGLATARDGSGDLSDGLGQARAGGDELSTGLGDLSDGASRIADGLAALDAGGATLIGGLGQLADGSGELATGVGELSAGATLLDGKAKELAAGSGQLATGAGDLQTGVQSLSAQLVGTTDPTDSPALQSFRNGIGAPGTANTLLDGLKKISDGLTLVQTSLGTPADGPTTLRGTAATATGALAGAEALNNGVESGLGTLETDLDTIAGVLDGFTIDAGEQAAYDTEVQKIRDAADSAATLEASAATLGDTIDSAQALVAGIEAGLTSLSTSVGAPTGNPADATLRNGVFLVTFGISNPGCDQDDPVTTRCGLLEGLEILEATIAAGLGDATTEDTLLWGAAQVAGGSALVAGGASQLQAEGTAPIAAGAAKAADGADQLAAGAAAADAGAAQLGDGAGQLADGSVELAAGAERAASGSSDLANGLKQLDDGGQQLASGLGDAADGSQQLADGLAQATPGGEQIAAGAQRLTDEGTSVLARSVSDASASSSLQLEHVKAVAARGTDGDGLPYPTADGADASAVYKFELAGIGADTGPGVAGRLGIGALALLAAALLGSMAGGRMGRREDVLVNHDELVEA